MLNKNLLLFGILLASIILIGCNLPKDFIDFYNLPKDKRALQFASLPIDKQIDYHLYAMSMEPPDFTFSEEIAKNGNRIIPPVLYRLKIEKRDRKKVDLLVILKDLCRNENCRNAEPSFFTEVENEVSKMHDPEWRRMAEESLSYIKGNPVPFPQYPRGASTPSQPE